MQKSHSIALTMVLLLVSCVSSGFTIASSVISEHSEYVPSLITAEYDETDFVATEILGRPTDTSITLNVVPAVSMHLYYEYGLAPGIYSVRTADQTAGAGVPLETLISNLEPNTRYYYRLRYDGAAGPEHSFTTQRAEGSPFSFAVQADSHLNTDKHCNPQLYAITMNNVADTQPDFFIDLGDTFRTDKLKLANQENIAQLYIDQREYFDKVSASAPLFLVNGNHEMEWGWLLDGNPNTPSVWSANSRNLYYPEPEPDSFYTGDLMAVENIGLLHDYYAWTWGDALFVVIDPYWSTTTDPKQSKDNWDWTLGETQYQWFRHTLESSRAEYKFVFTHHVLGETRGGVEMAKYFEWGGYDRNGTWGFDRFRPGWGLPIQQVMADNGVTIFFQGHDHLYARQELDGVIYQTVPMPADDSYQTPNADAYISGVTRPESGFLSVTVSEKGVTVDYIRSFLPEDETSSAWNGMLDYSYTIPAR